MSVQVLDTGTFNYIATGIEKSAWQTTIDEFFIAEFSTHFKDKDTQTEVLRLVNSWIVLNEKSYCHKYKEPYSPELLKCLEFNKEPLTGIQYLKFIQCLVYNMEIYFPVTEQEQKDYDFLKRIEVQLMQSNIASLPAWKAAKWS